MIKETNWHERLKYAIKKFGYNSEFIKSYHSMTAQLRHDELDKFFDVWCIPRF